MNNKIKAALPRPEQNPECYVDVLQILGSGHAGHILRPGPDVENVGFLNPGDHEVGALADDALADSGNAIEDDCSVAALHVVQG